jgi:hypothetical protein
MTPADHPPTFQTPSWRPAIRRLRADSADAPLGLDHRFCFLKLRRHFHHSILRDPVALGSGMGQSILLPKHVVDIPRALHRYEDLVEDQFVRHLDDLLCRR